MEPCRICNAPGTTGGYCGECGPILLTFSHKGLEGVEFFMGAATVARRWMNGAEVRAAALEALQERRPWQYRELRRVLEEATP